MNPTLEASSHPPKLLDQLRGRIRVKHYSIRTEQAYVHWVKRYLFFHGMRHQNLMGKVEIEKLRLYVVHSKRRLGGRLEAQHPRPCWVAPT